MEATQFECGDAVTSEAEKITCAASVEGDPGGARSTEVAGGGAGVEYSQATVPVFIRKLQLETSLNQDVKGIDICNRTA
jgi:hypothetical protein